MGKYDLIEFTMERHPDPDVMDGDTVYQMVKLSYKWVDKVLTDRLNHLKSDLAHQRRPKMDKTIDEQRITLTEAKIEELENLRKQWR